MGLIYFWYCVKALGGFSESDFQAVLEEAQRELPKLSPDVHNFIHRWVQFLDSLEKEGGTQNRGFVNCGSLTIEFALQRNDFVGIANDLKVTLSELRGLSNLSSDDLAKSLVNNELLTASDGCTDTKLKKLSNDATDLLQAFVDGESEMQQTLHAIRADANAKTDDRRTALIDCKGKAAEQSSNPERPVDWVPNQPILDEFVVEGVLGEGGMGKVYLLRNATSRGRFAVKRAKRMTEADRRRFLAELQIWIDLPDHPNLVPCRFFRTMGPELVIFAEYVEGGSLASLIESGRLYEGGAKAVLERMLDMAIQFAWGLHCMHDLGLIHQDVKPGNVLIGLEGSETAQLVRVRVTDFGLVRARAAGGERILHEQGQSILASSSGGTPAYWSPEQADGLPVTRATDIWSWAVSVLQMFSGEVTWHAGQAAPEALQQYEASRNEGDSIPPMPEAVVSLLKKCLKRNPLERISSLSGAVEELKAAYSETIGVEYSRPLQTVTKPGAPQSGVKKRHTREGGIWDDPREWLRMALREAGRNPAEAEAVMAKQGVTRRGNLVADLAIYEEAKRIYKGLTEGGCKDVENDLAELCEHKAMVHEAAGDTPGCLAECDQAIEIWERRVDREGYSEFANILARALNKKASVVEKLGDLRSAVALRDRVIGIRERIVQQDGFREFADDLANAYVGKANALRTLGEIQGAVALYDQAIEIFEGSVHMEGRGPEIDAGLALAYNGKALAFQSLGKSQAGVALISQAIEIWERLVQEGGCSELANDLAMAYLNKAASTRASGDTRGAMTLYDRAIEIREHLVHQEGRSELANDLAVAYNNKAAALQALGKNQAAVTLYDRVIEIREQLVHQEGHRELGHALANAYRNKAIAVSNSGDQRAAVALYDQAIDIWERLVNQEGRQELTNDLASACLNKAIAIATSGDARAAVGLFDNVIGMLEPLVRQQGRHDLAFDLASAYMSKAVAVATLGDRRAAVGLYDGAIEIQERLLREGRRSDIRGDLAWAKGSRGNLLMSLGEANIGRQQIREAMKDLETEIARTGRSDLKGVLAWLNQQSAER